MNPGKAIQNKINGVKQNFADYKKLDSREDLLERIFP